MINISVVRDNEGFIWSFSIKGHAEYSELGSDIVCAAVSAIAYTAVGALEELAGVKNYSEHSGYMKCVIPKDIDDNVKDKIKIILETAVIGFKQVEFSYKKYVRVLDEEV